MKKKLQKKILKNLKESNRLSEQILKELELLTSIYRNNSNSNSKGKNRTIPNVPKEDRAQLNEGVYNDTFYKKLYYFCRTFKPQIDYDVCGDGNEIPKPPKDRVNKEGEIPKPPKSKRG